MAKKFTDERITKPGIYQIRIFEGKELLDDLVTEVYERYGYKGELEWDVEDFPTSVELAYDEYLGDMTIQQRKMRDLKCPYTFSTESEIEEYLKNKKKRK